MSRGGSELEGTGVVTADSRAMSDNSKEKEVVAVRAEVKWAPGPVAETVAASENWRESEGKPERSDPSE